MSERSRAIFSTKVATRSNMLVRDIVVGFFQRIGTPRAISDEHVSALRVIVGLAMREAAMFGVEYAQRGLAPRPKGKGPPPLPAPAAVETVVQKWDEETTVPMGRRPRYVLDQGDE